MRDLFFGGMEFDEKIGSTRDEENGERGGRERERERERDVCVWGGGGEGGPLEKQAKAGEGWGAVLLGFRCL